MTDELPERVQRLIRLAVALMIIIALTQLLPILRSMRNPNGPPGEVFPTSLPNENNRIYHPLGFSIVAPENWEQRPIDNLSLPYLQIYARVNYGRLKSMITITKWDRKPDASMLEPCTHSTFQGESAWEYCRVTKKYTFDDGARSEYDLYFERDQVWWNVSFLVADTMKELPESIRRYLDTIRTTKSE